MWVVLNFSINSNASVKKRTQNQNKANFKLMHLEFRTEIQKYVKKNTNGFFF